MIDEVQDYIDLGDEITEDSETESNGESTEEEVTIHYTFTDGRKKIALLRLPLCRSTVVCNIAMRWRNGGCSSAPCCFTVRSPYQYVSTIFTHSPVGSNL